MISLIFTVPLRRILSLGSCALILPFRNSLYAVIAASYAEFPDEVDKVAGGVPVTAGVDGVGPLGVLPDVAGVLLTTGVLLTAGLDSVWDDGAVGVGAVLVAGGLDICAEDSLGAGVDTVGVPGLPAFPAQAQRRSVNITASNRESDFLTLHVYFIATSPCIIYS